LFGGTPTIARTRDARRPLSIAHWDDWSCALVALSNGIRRRHRAR
jgi:hypothetical protein